MDANGDGLLKAREVQVALGPDHLPADDSIFLDLKVVAAIDDGDIQGADELISAENAFAKFVLPSRPPTPAVTP